MIKAGNVWYPKTKKGIEQAREASQNIAKAAMTERNKRRLHETQRRPKSVTRQWS